jgi:hypothetical protein
MIHRLWKTPEKCLWKTSSLLGTRAAHGPPQRMRLKLASLVS